MENLNINDIDVLIESLDLWESSNLIEQALLEAMMLNIPHDKNDSLQKNMINKAIKEFKRKEEDRIKNRKKISILLKAKLINIQSKILDQKSELTVDDLNSKKI